MTEAVHVNNECYCVCMCVYRMTYLFLVGSFLFCCQSCRLVQILVTDFTLKPLQVHKHLAEMFPVKLEQRQERCFLQYTPSCHHSFNFPSDKRLCTPNFYTCACSSYFVLLYPSCVFWFFWFHWIIYNNAVFPLNFGNIFFFVKLFSTADSTHSI